MTKGEIQRRSGRVVFWSGPFVDGSGRWVDHPHGLGFQSVRYNIDRDPGDEDDGFMRTEKFSGS